MNVVYWRFLGYLLNEPIQELKNLIWRCFIIYWNNWRICSANGGLPPMLKREQYYDCWGKKTTQKFYFESNLFDKRKTALGIISRAVLSIV